MPSSPLPLLLGAAEAGAEAAHGATAVAAPGHHHDVPFTTTLIFAGVLVAMVTALALEEKLHAKKSVICGVTAIVALFLGGLFHVLPFGPVIDVFGDKLQLPVYIPSIDWGVITIILGASLFVDVTSKSGLFTWIAIRLTKASGGDPWKLLIYYGVMTVVFSAVLNNVTAMLIVGSLTAVSLDKLGAKQRLLGFLLVEGLLTNVGGLLTLISSVPNIIVGKAAGIGFVQFFLVASPYVLVTTAATIFLGARIFGIHGLKTDEEKAQAKRLVAGFDENDSVDSPGFFRFATVMFILFILTLATTSVIPVVKDLDMGYVCLAFAVIMLIRYKSTVDRFYAALDWDLLLFFASLFVVIGVMEHAQVLELIGSGIGRILALGDRLGAGALLAAAAGASAVTDNIPLSAVLAKILSTKEFDGQALWWAVVFGANLGGNLTPIGSASTVVAVTVMSKHKLGMSFGRFVKLALPFAALHIALAIVYVIVFIR